MNFSTNKKLRITLKVLILLCFSIITLIFVDRCILSRDYIALNAMCPMTSATNCFYYESALDFMSKSFYCPPNEPISATNITAELVLCFTWEIKSQTVISVLSQMGICSSILCLLGLFFKSLYHLASYQYWGTLLTIALGLAMIIVPIILWLVFRIAISFILFMIIFTAVLLLLNAFFLVRIVKISQNKIIVRQPTALDRKHVEP
jgi:hypothetical protein